MSSKRKIIRSGNGSYYITLPREILKNLKFKEGQFVEIIEGKEKIIIKDWKEN